MSPGYVSGGWIKEDLPRDRPDRTGNPYVRLVAWIRERCPWLPWVFGIVVLFVGVTVLCLWITDFFKSPEEQYAAQCRKYLLGGEGREGEITQAEEQRIQGLAKVLRFSQEKGDEICLGVKQAIYREREKEYLAKPGSKAGISEKDREALGELAIRMGIDGSPKEPGKLAERQDTAKPGTVEEVKKLLEHGRYSEARELITKFPNNPEVSSLADGFDSLMDVKVSFQFQRPGEPASQVYPVGAEELRGLSLTHKDSYRLLFETGDKCHLYIFQMDELGKVDRIFPDPQTLDPGNPLQSLIRYRIPSGKQEWFFLDEFPGDKKVMNETFYVLAARWEGKDLDEAYAEVCGATKRPEWEKALNHLMERIKARGEVQKSGVFYKEFLVRHGR